MYYGHDKVSNGSVLLTDFVKTNAHKFFEV